MAHLAHHVPGRLRLKLPIHMRDADAIAQYAELMRAQPGVLEVSTNTRSGSVVVRYDPKTTGSRVLLETAGHGDGDGARPLSLPHLGSARSRDGTDGAPRRPADGAMQRAAQTFGIAVGHALFNAAFKFSVERSVSTLLRRR